MAVGASGAVDPGREVRGAAAHDGDVRGDERNLLSPTHGLFPGGICRPFPPRSTVYNIFRQFRRDGVWERIWEGRTSYGAARGARPRGQPHRRDPRQPVAESGDGSSSTRSASAFHGWNLFGPTQATTPIRSRVPWPDRRGSGSKSSSGLDGVAKLFSRSCGTIPHRKPAVGGEEPESNNQERQPK